jgi:hypothetical protein
MSLDYNRSNRRWEDGEGNSLKVDQVLSYVRELEARPQTTSASWRSRLGWLIAGVLVALFGFALFGWLWNGVTWLFTAEPPSIGWLIVLAVLTWRSFKLFPRWHQRRNPDAPTFTGRLGIYGTTPSTSGSSDPDDTQPNWFSRTRKRIRQNLETSTAGGTT